MCKATFTETCHTLQPPPSPSWSKLQQSMHAKLEPPKLPMFSPAPCHCCSTNSSEACMQSSLELVDQQNNRGACVHNALGSSAPGSCPCLALLLVIGRPTPAKHELAKPVRMINLLSFMGRCLFSRKKQPSKRSGLWRRDFPAHAQGGACRHHLSLWALEEMFVQRKTNSKSKRSGQGRVFRGRSM